MNTGGLYKGDPPPIAPGYPPKQYPVDPEKHSANTRLRMSTVVCPNDTAAATAHPTVAAAMELAVLEWHDALRAEASPA